MCVFTTGKYCICENSSAGVGYAGSFSVFKNKKAFLILFVFSKYNTSTPNQSSKG